MGPGMTTCPVDIDYSLQTPPHLMYIRQFMEKKKYLCNHPSLQLLTTLDKALSR